MEKLLSLLLLSVLAPASFAATCLWTNASGGGWQAATNWQPNLVPGAADTALVTNAGNYTVVVVTVAALTVGGPGLGFATSSVSGTLTFTDTNAWRYTRRFYNLTN